MTPQQELATKYGIAIKTNKQGRRVTVAWTKQNGGQMAECQVALNSPAYPLVEQALKD